MTESIQERDQLRALQDQFLAHPRTIQFCEEYGYTASLFDHGIGPSAGALQTRLVPEYANAMQSLLDAWTKEAL